MDNKMDYIGDFEVESGSVMVSDPCYKPGTWCQAKLDDVYNGKWKAWAIQRDGRVAELIASCMIVDDPYDIGETLIDPERKKPFDIGVDSGQCGIFDAKHYQQDSDIVDDPEFDAILGEGTTKHGVGDRWYNACCDITLEGGEGVIPFGVVCQSGYGDGSYDLYVEKHAGKIISIKIVFIGPDEEASDYWGEDE